MPARDFLHALKAGMWEPDPDADQLPADEQLKDYDWFIDTYMYFSNFGVPRYKDQVNSLDDGIWEFRYGAKRLSWYDTPGDGSYTPKLKIKDRSRSTYSEDEFWWVPDFDRHIRLGHAFPKRGQKTGSLDIKETLRVRKEDLQHDQAPSQGPL